MRILIVITLIMLGNTGLKAQEASREHPWFSQLSLYPTIVLGTTSLTVGKYFSDREALSLTLQADLGYIISSRFGRSTWVQYDRKLRDINSSAAWHLPIWIGTKFVNRNVGFEEGYFPHYMWIAGGAGLGIHYGGNDQWTFRTEIGIGPGFNFTDTNPSEPILYPWAVAADFKLSDSWPVLPFIRFRQVIQLNMGRKKAPSQDGTFD